MFEIMAGFTPDGAGLCDVNFAQLRPHVPNMRKLGFRDLPHWSDIHASLTVTIERRAGVRLDLAGFPVVVNQDAKSVLLYAGGLAYLMESLLQVKVGISLGGILLMSRRNPDNFYGLPTQPDKSGLQTGFHAWAILDDEGKIYVADFFHHWLGGNNKDMLGPSKYIVASVGTLDQHRIVYYPNENLTGEIGAALASAAAQQLATESLVFLRDRINARM
ncbi:MAG: hypothetical protein ORN98_07595 [Alphaproteobacteria bacterium]|nr:hypothetical protein [Alphaproteobacteria bacterium]